MLLTPTLEFDLVAAVAKRALADRHRKERRRGR